MEILTHPHPILQKKAQKIKDPLNEEIQKLIPKMIKTMKTADGVGLAAPQIGESIQLSVIQENPRAKIIVLINPKITALSKGKSIDKEGCLSVPGKNLNIERAENIKIRYLNEKSEKQKLKAKGLLARIIQHELDHLNGVLIIDKK